MSSWSWLAIAILILQILFAAHAIKTGRNLLWILLIIFFPLFGLALYAIIELLPDLRASGATRRAAATLTKTLDPGRELRRQQAELELAGTVENKTRLARAYLERRDYEQAIRLFESAATGIHKDDPDILQGLAQAYFLGQRPADAKAALEKLRQAHPNHKSPEAHLLYARVLEALGEDTAALREFEAVAAYYPGAEAKVRYGQLLKRLGRIHEARTLFKELLTVAEHAPDHYRRAQKEWLSIAARELSQV